MDSESYVISAVAFGRVLRASTTGFVLGCRVGELATPSFGCLVKAQPVDEREVIFGLIYNMNVDDDPLVRRLVLADNQPEAVINDQRRNRLLPIEMSVLAVGYSLNGRVTHGLPPRPPLNLDPVVLCQEAAEIRAFTDRLGYLRLILRTMNSDVPVDQLLVAHIQQIYEARGNDRAWATAAVNEIIELLRGNYDLLVPVLEALGDAIPALGETTPAPPAGRDDLIWGGF
jgi:hypothetical protein